MKLFIIFAETIVHGHRFGIQAYFLVSEAVLRGLIENVKFLLSEEALVLIFFFFSLVSVQ